MRKLLIFFTLLAGIIGGILRAYEWRLAWNKDLDLMTPNHYLSLCLLGFSLLFAAALLFIMLGSPSRRKRELGPSPRLARALWWLDAPALLALFVSAGLDIREYLLRPAGSATPGLSSLIFVGFSVFTGICVLVIMVASARNVPTRDYGVYMLTPVFWACFWLVQSIGKYAINPVSLSYLYNLLGTIFAVMALYAAAGFFFSQTRIRRSLIYCSLGVYFSIVTLLGVGVYRLLEIINGVQAGFGWAGWVYWSEWPVSGFRANDFCRFLFVVFHLLALMRMDRTWKMGLSASEPAED